MMRKILVYAVMLLTALGLCAPAFAAGSQDTMGIAPGDLPLMAGDVIYVRIPQDPALSGEYTIAENGKLYFPVLESADLGSINVLGCQDMTTGEARGCTVREVQSLIQAKLANFFVDSSVTVELVSYTVRAAYNVSIYGQVQSPDAYKYQEGMKLLDAFILGGMIMDKADLKHVRILRGDMTISLDVTGMLNGADMSNNIELKPGDYIIVPTSEPQEKIKILVLGQVDHVGSFYLPEGATVLDAFAAAGGARGRAGMGKAYLIRVVDSRPTAVPVDFKALINRLDIAQNRVLMMNDILFIPESGGVNLNEVISNLNMFNLLSNTYDSAIQ